MYGIDQNIVSPPFSLIISLILMAGCDRIGIWGLRLIGLPCSDLRQWSRWQAPIVGAMALAVILYPLALAGLTPRMFMQGVAFLICITGLLHIIRGVPSCKSYCNDFLTLINARPGHADAWGMLFLLLLVGDALLAMGPVTSNDSLDYHMGVPVALLNVGGMPVMPEWLSSRLAGSGEVLNAVGLAAGAEQFSSLLQFAGLLGIIGLLLCAESSVEHGQQRAHAGIIRFLALIAVATPDLLSEMCSSKPQILPVGMTSLALALLIFPSRRHLSSRDSILNFVLVCMLVMVASQTKLAYMLSGGVIGLFAMTLMARQSLLIPAVGIGTVLATLIMGPHLIWEMHYFGAGFIDALTKPLPGIWPGGEAFAAYGRSFSGFISSFPFPISIIIPSGIDSAAHVLGFGALLIFAVRPKRDPWLWSGLIVSLSVMLGTALLGPPSGRYYLEPYFWSLLLLAMSPSSILVRIYPWFRWGILAQSMCALVVMYYGVATLSPGALTPEWRKQVMNRSANGYTLMQWLDSVLPKDAVLLTPHRSMALVPRKAVSMYWTNWIPINYEPYLELIKKRGVTHILVLNDDARISGCFGKLVAEGKHDHFASRNPYNHGPYSMVKVYEFKSQQLPGCASQGLGESKNSK